MATEARALSPEEFRAVARSRGYNLAAIARIWGLTAARLSQIAADPKRAPYFDLALWGLPAKVRYQAITARRVLAASASARDRGSKRGPGRPRGTNRQAFDMDAYWADATAIGSTFTVTQEQGGHILEGSEATVVSRTDRGGELRVGVKFSTGYIEEFSVRYLQEPTCFLWPTGKTPATKEPFG